MKDDLKVISNEEKPNDIPLSSIPDVSRFLDTIPAYDEAFTIEKLNELILKGERSYEHTKIITAYQFAAKAHEGQMRSSGKPYITHPLAVAYTLLELGMDTDTICAALLHDVVEDTEITLEDVKKRFGQDVALLVDGVTKLGKVSVYTKEEQQAENIRKMLLAMSQDIRVMIIKLADRLHNMRTLKYRPPEKQRYTAHETMDIFAPIAHRLGISAIKDELQDLAFHYLDPFAYNEIEGILENSKEVREAFIMSIKNRISERLNKEEFKKTPQIDGRVKSVYSIYRKIYMNQKNIDEIYDKYAVRVIVSTIAECYNVLGLIHDMFKPMPNRFKDYIANPKANKYQSLHTTVLGSEGIPFEVQIRTWEMHETAEYGIAAHWKYKEGINGKDKMEQHLAWVRQVIEAQKTSDDVEEIVNIIKSDLTLEDIVVMTPRGKSILLPVRSTVIDFAYLIHTDVGHKACAAKVNGKMVPLDYVLETGELCEIITSKDPQKGPSRQWLNFVRTSAARSKIRSWFKKERHEENIIEGKNQLEREFKRNRIKLAPAEYNDFLCDLFRKHNCENLEDFYASIGYGGISLSKIMPRLRDKYEKQFEEKKEILPQPVVPNPASKTSIILDDIDNCTVKYAQCCNPIPGDDIVGFITRGFGLSIHKSNCINYLKAVERNDPETIDRWFDVKWNDNVEDKIQTSFEVIAVDRVGFAFDVTSVLYEAKVPIVHSASRILKNGNAIFEATIVISGTEQLNHIFDKIKKIKGYISVERSINN
ncbi:MAG: bifunctional (p)ppGpp synthetase/guanosine-3',5'-bis(diphosphate) 3'-pyrophosphohydrolase [Ruminococcus sp.]|nr:bifunctional (p)ppGpp synthetase/guanosine-3',5'-bis(diphosphate) 3'-pyrophosphohydrolase [Ruminococcus sp.]